MEAGKMSEVGAVVNGRPVEWFKDVDGFHGDAARWRIEDERAWFHDENGVVESVHTTAEVRARGTPCPTPLLNANSSLVVRDGKVVDAPPADDRDATIARLTAERNDLIARRQESEARLAEYDRMAYEGWRPGDSERDRLLADLAAERDVARRAVLDLILANRRTREVAVKPSMTAAFSAEREACRWREACREATLIVPEEPDELRYAINRAVADAHRRGRDAGMDSAKADLADALRRAGVAAPDSVKTLGASYAVELVLDAADAAWAAELKLRTGIDVPDRRASPAERTRAFAELGGKVKSAAIAAAEARGRSAGKTDAEWEFRQYAEDAGVTTLDGLDGPKGVIEHAIRHGFAQVRRDLATLAGVPLPARATMAEAVEAIRVAGHLAGQQKLLDVAGVSDYREYHEDRTLQQVVAAIRATAPKPDDATRRDLFAAAGMVDAGQDVGTVVNLIRSNAREAVSWLWKKHVAKATGLPVGTVQDVAVAVAAVRDDGYAVGVAEGRSAMLLEVAGAAGVAARQTAGELVAAIRDADRTRFDSPAKRAIAGLVVIAKSPVGWYASNGMRGRSLNGPVSFDVLLPAGAVLDAVRIGGVDLKLPHRVEAVGEAGRTHTTAELREAVRKGRERAAKQAIDKLGIWPGIGPYPHYYIDETVDPPNCFMALSAAGQTRWRRGSAAWSTRAECASESYLTGVRPCTKEEAEAGMTESQTASDAEFELAMLRASGPLFTVGQLREAVDKSRKRMARKCRNEILKQNDEVVRLVKENRSLRKLADDNAAKFVAERDRRMEERASRKMEDKRSRVHSEAHIRSAEWNEQKQSSEDWCRLIHEELGGFGEVPSGVAGAVRYIRSFKSRSQPVLRADVAPPPTAADDGVERREYPKSGDESYSVEAGPHVGWWWKIENEVATFFLPEKGWVKSAVEIKDLRDGASGKRPDIYRCGPDLKPLPPRADGPVGPSRWFLSPLHEDDCPEVLRVTNDDKVWVYRTNAAPLVAPMVAARVRKLTLEIAEPTLTHDGMLKANSPLSPKPVSDTAAAVPDERPATDTRAADEARYYVSYDLVASFGPKQFARARSNEDVSYRRGPDGEWEDAGVKEPYFSKFKAYRPCSAAEANAGLRPLASDWVNPAAAKGAGTRWWVFRSAGTRLVYRWVEGEGVSFMDAAGASREWVAMPSLRLNDLEMKRGSPLAFPEFSTEAAAVAYATGRGETAPAPAETVPLDTDPPVPFVAVGRVLHFYGPDGKITSSIGLDVSVEFAKAVVEDMTNTLHLWVGKAVSDYARQADRLLVDEYTRLVAWLDNPNRKMADVAFTAGAVRDAARAFEASGVLAGVANAVAAEREACIVAGEMVAATRLDSDNPSASDGRTWGDSVRSAGAYAVVDAIRARREVKHGND